MSPFVLYGCETWSVIFREAHRLEVFGKGVLVEIFGLKMKEGLGDWRKSHTEEHRDL